MHDILPQKNQEELIQKRFQRKIEAEKSLNFLDALFHELPELEMYLVGGIVRDTLISEDVKSKDYDFIARGVEPKRLQEALGKLGKVIVAGKRFGVIKFYPKGSTLQEPIDIAYPRTEHSTGAGGKRTFKVQSNHLMKVEDDLSRRDLTFNAIAWDIKRQNAGNIKVFG